MAYTKITLEAVIHADDSEMLEQALNDAMEEIVDQVTVYSSEMKSAETNKPENADEIAASRASQF